MGVKCGLQAAQQLGAGSLSRVHLSLSPGHSGVAGRQLPPPRTTAHVIINMGMPRFLPRRAHLEPPPTTSNARTWWIRKKEARANIFRHTEAARPARACGPPVPVPGRGSWVDHCEALVRRRGGDSGSTIEIRGHEHGQGWVPCNLRLSSCSLLSRPLSPASPPSASSSDEAPSRSRPLRLSPAPRGSSTSTTTGDNTATPPGSGSRLADCGHQRQCSAVGPPCARPRSPHPSTLPPCKREPATPPVPHDRPNEAVCSGIQALPDGRLAKYSPL
jgi:hypothetical protein